MEVDRKVLNRLRVDEDKDDGYVQADRAELISLMWEITEDVWSFVRNQDAEQRLQRNVAVLIGRTS